VSDQPVTGSDAQKVKDAIGRPATPPTPKPPTPPPAKPKMPRAPSQKCWPKGKP